MGPVTVSQMTRKGNPHVVPRGRENRVLYNFPPDWRDVSGTRGRGEGPGPGQWDMAVCLWAGSHHLGNGKMLYLS